ncbi:MAG: hypothetical protein LC662_13760 [Rhodothermaceae bacterium]|nr:hypothetical protein [Rhodothermaceae bacterium]
MGAFLGLRVKEKGSDLNNLYRIHILAAAFCISFMVGCMSRESGVISLDLSAAIDNGSFSCQRGEYVVLTLASDRDTVSVVMHSDETGIYRYFADPEWLVPDNIYLLVSIRDSLDSLLGTNATWIRHSGRDIRSGVVLEWTGEREAGFTEVGFTVRMHNQEVLGFFKPERGDIVRVWVLAGNDSLSTDLYPDKLGLTWQGTIPISLNGTIPLHWKYQMVPGMPGIRLPSKGAERSKWRTTEIGLWRNVHDTPGVWFGDLQHVVRFVFDSSPELPWKPYIARLWSGTNEVLTPEFIRLPQGHYESAVSLNFLEKEWHWELIDEQGASIAGPEKLDLKPEGLVIMVNRN